MIPNEPSRDKNMPNIEEMLRESRGSSEKVSYTFNWNPRKRRARMVQKQYLKRY